MQRNINVPSLGKGLTRIFVLTSGQKKMGVSDDASYYRLRRQSRLNRHYDPPWLWREITMPMSGDVTISVPMPRRDSHLALTAYSLHQRQGMAILPQPIVVSLISYLMFNHINKMKIFWL